MMVRIFRIGWRGMEDTRECNERTRRSHAKVSRHPSYVPGHPSLRCPCDTRALSGLAMENG